CQQDTDWSLTF
nr:immunoglobulin light chain junction region [Macaca mulatta]